MYKMILAPLDGSEFSECCLPHVKTIALGCGVPEVVLLRVAEPVLNQDVAAYARAGRELMAKVEADNQAKVKEYLDGVGGRLRKDGVSIRTVMKLGRPADAILDFAQGNKIDLIIMTTHGRSGASHFFLGSVADRVMRHSHVAVLMVRPPGCLPEATKG